MNKTIDYFIDSKNPERPAESDDLASFEYYFEKELNIKSVTLKSIMFYIAYVDLKKGIIYKQSDDGDGLAMTFAYPIEDQKKFNLNDYCDFLNRKEILNVKYYCDKNHLIIELLETMIFTLSDPDPDPRYVTLNELIGFKPGEILFFKGKYRSPKSVIDTPPILYLRSNLVDKQNTFYNNKYSDILCHFPADIDEDSHKLQIYEPLNCTKNVYKRTNHLKFKITDENGKVINFRGKPVKIHLTFEIFPLIDQRP